MADLNKQENIENKRTYRRKSKSVKPVSVDLADIDSQRLTDDNGKLKFLKTSKYLQTLTQGEE
jgi:hypothetical protein